MYEIGEQLHQPDTIQLRSSPELEYISGVHNTAERPDCRSTRTEGFLGLSGMTA